MIMLTSNMIMSFRLDELCDAINFAEIKELEGYQTSVSIDRCSVTVSCIKIP